MQRQRIRVWDLPTRLFHWLLALCVSAALITGQIGGAAIDWHGRIGLVIVGLIVFRLVWGLIGSRHARFASFVPTPTTLAAYLRGQWRGVGHNPLGALSVLGLLALVAIQLSTGLLANDDIAFHGPLYDLVSKELSDRLTGIHTLSSTLLIALIVLHLAAIAFYAHIKKDKLVKPMVTGWKEVDPELGDQSSDGVRSVALIVALAVALAAAYGASGAWLPAAAAPAPSAPAW